MINRLSRYLGPAPLFATKDMRVVDGRHTFPVRVASLATPQCDSKTAGTTVVFANGFLEGRGVLGQAVKGWLRAAYEDGYPLRVITYDDPVVGKSAYGQDYRTEQFAAAVRFAATQFDCPVTVGAHSRGWISAAEAAPALLKEGLIEGMGGIAVAGHCAPNLDKLERALRVAQVMRGAVGEALGSRSAIRDIGSVSMVACLFGTAVRHLGCHLPSAIGEIDAILGRDVTAQIAEVSKQIPVRLAPCMRDAIFPGETVVQNLQGKFTGILSPFEARHGEPIVYPNWARPAYEVLTGVQHNVALAA